MAYAGVLEQGRRYVFVPPDKEGGHHDENEETQVLLQRDTSLNVEGTQVPVQRADRMEKETQEKPPAVEVVAEGNDEEGDEKIEEDRDLKAVKAGDATIPIWLWNDAIVVGLSKPPSW
jgi:hypothetical protein